MQCCVKIKSEFISEVCNGEIDFIGTILFQLLVWAVEEMTDTSFR